LEFAMLFGQLALIAAAVFTGAALYVSLCEQPARLLLDDQSLLAEWKPAYKRGALMQAPLALMGFLLGILAWWQTASPTWAIGGIVLLANWPVTLFVIMPTNRRLMATENAGPQTRAMVVKWGRLHALRTALGFAASFTFLLASL
jgi:hypothetical protein